MIGTRAFIALSAVVLGIPSLLGTALASGEVKSPREGGWVVPCSLNGVNPVHHRDIFGNPAVARSYGFVQARDGSWQVQSNCRR
jgi:hypothetical protein